jgi:hypothetical protein
MRKRKAEWTSPSNPVSLESAGVTHHGSYQVENGMIRVSYKGASKVTHLGGSAVAPEGLARLILSELVRETPTGF